MAINNKNVYTPIQKVSLNRQPKGIVSNINLVRFSGAQFDSTKFVDATTGAITFKELMLVTKDKTSGLFVPVVVDNTGKGVLDATSATNVGANGVYLSWYNNLDVEFNIKAGVANYDYSKKPPVLLNNTFDALIFKVGAKVLAKYITIQGSVPTAGYSANVGDIVALLHLTLNGETGRYMTDSLTAPETIQL